jgi:hypothetical protein
VGAAGIPSLTRWLGVDRLLSGSLLRLGSGGGSGDSGGSRRNTVRLPILREVKGVLRPVRSHSHSIHHPS